MSAINLSKFGKDIINFRNGNLSYSASFNSVGNLILKNNPIKYNDTFVVINTSDYIYNKNKLNQLYDLTFSEFTDTSSVESTASPTSVNTPSDEPKNTSLVLLANQASQLKFDISSSKNDIINLRISSSQGSVSTDFSNVFPYLPLNS